LWEDSMAAARQHENHCNGCRKSTQVSRFAHGLTPFLSAKWLSGQEVLVPIVAYSADLESTICAAA
jgi:hypothetical protein